MALLASWRWRFAVLTVNTTAVPPLIAAVERGEMMLYDAVSIVGYEAEVQNAALAAKKAGHVSTGASGGGTDKPATSPPPPAAL